MYQQSASISQVLSYCGVIGGGGGNKGGLTQ